MDTSKDLIINIYKDAEMGIFTIEQLLTFLEEKDNKIKPLVEDINQQYEEFKNKAKELIEKRRRAK